MCYAGLMLAVLVGISGASAEPLVPFVIPLEMAPQRPWGITSASLTENDRLAARDHFYTPDGRRVRLWGVNLSFDANFPTHQDADKVARRLADFGVNAVRFHHMDTTSWPRGLWAEDGKTLHPEALDRLDYFIDRLAKCGIYADLNLHVGRAHSRGLGLPQAKEDFDKIVTIFTPALIDAQKDYARMLLTHKNPYRGLTYAEDYAVAIVEITNENSLFMWSADRVLPTLPEVYAQELRRQYNQWLKGRYATTERLAAAWTKGSMPLGAEMLKNGSFSAFAQGQAAPADWMLEQHADCRATLKKADFNGRPALAVEPVQVSGTDWHLQINQRSLSVQAGRVYTIYVEAAATEACRVSLSVLQGHEPWGNLGLWRPMELKPDWQTLTLTFTATGTDDNARLGVAFGDCKTPFAIAAMSLRPGVEYAMEKGESLEQGTVNVFAGVESEVRKIDRMMFLAETEKAFFDGMRQYVKKDLGYQGMVTGTIVFGPLGQYAQSDMDFIDSHAYWQHPRFPRRPWDAADWTIEQKAMSNYPEKATLFELAAERLKGKPFTVTEYNHPAPLDSQAECVPMLASFAAVQDWDGVWLYTYSHSGHDWAREFMNSYFDIDTNPAKWGFMPAGRVIFREGLPPSGTQPAKITAPAGTDKPSVEAFAKLHLKAGSNMLAATGQTPKQEILRLAGQASGKTHFDWDVVDQKGLYAVRNDFYCVLTGSTERFQTLSQGFKIKIEQPAFAAITVTSLDGKSLGTDCEKMLITACGRCENTGMQFSEDRTTVGQNWGKAPVCIEPVAGTLQFNGSSRFSGSGVTCKALNPDGTVRKTFPVTGGRIPLSADCQTMWYLVEREPTGPAEAKTPTFKP